MSLLNSAILYLSIVFTITLNACLKNEYTVGLIRYISDNLLIHTHNRLVKAYSLTWFSFLTYNLFASVFSVPNFFVIDENNIVFTFLFIASNTVFMLLFALIEVGPRNMLRSIYEGGDSGFLASLLSVVICIINLLTNFLIKPFSLILRIVINIFIGNKFHEIFEEYAYGVAILEFLGLVKFLMYFIQVYIIMLLSNKIYLFLTQSALVDKK